MQVEAELQQLEAAEASEYLESLGVSEGGLRSLVQATYDQLGLATYFTTGGQLLGACQHPVPAQLDCALCGICKGWCDAIAAHHDQGRRYTQPCGRSSCSEKHWVKTWQVVLTWFM